MTRIRSRFAIALLLGAVAWTAVAAQTRRGEVAAAIPPGGPTADWVAQYGCGEVKSWSHAGVQQAFSTWSQRIAGSGARGAAADIATNGNIGALLGNLPDLLSLMDAALELTQGDPATAGDKILGLALDGSAAAIGGPGAAVYTIVKQMGSLADSLDQEILAINVRNYAEASVDDLTLLEVDRYLNAYLHWTEPSVAGVSALEMNRRRGMLYTYATRSLGHSSFPAYLDWSQQTVAEAFDEALSAAPAASASGQSSAAAAPSANRTTVGRLDVTTSSSTVSRGSSIELVLSYKVEVPAGTTTVSETRTLTVGGQLVPGYPVHDSIERIAGSYTSTYQQPVPAAAAGGTYEFKGEVCVGGDCISRTATFRVLE